MYRMRLYPIRVYRMYCRLQTLPGKKARLNPGDPVFKQAIAGIFTLVL